MLALRWYVATVLCGKSTFLSVFIFYEIAELTILCQIMIVLLIFHDLYNNFLLYFLVIIDYYN